MGGGDEEGFDDFGDFAIDEGVDEGAGDGVLGGGEDVFDGAVFDDGAVVHDIDVVADVADYVDFVGDEDDGDSEAFIEVF